VRLVRNPRPHSHRRPARRQKLAARIAVLREILAPIGDGLPGRCDRALLLAGFAGAFRRSELAGIAAEHLEDHGHRMRITLPASKGGRARKGVQVGIPYGMSELCPVRALIRWRAAAAIGPVLDPHNAIDPGTVARIVKARSAAAGFDRDLLGGHSLKRGALNMAKDRRVHSVQLKQLGRHASYATPATPR
jgi:hypothetical protein